MSSTLSVCVVGAGNWGRQHTRAFAARDDCTVTGVYSRRLERAEHRAAEVGARGYDDLDAMLRAEKPDLVTVCLPNTQHVEVTRHLLDQGLPLFVEKPLAFDVGEAREMVAAAASHDQFFAIDFNHRYAVPVVMARDAVERNQLGRLSFVSWRFGGEGNADSGPDGNLIETQCHGFDMIEYLAGRISSVMAQMTEFDGRGHSTVALSLAFADGAVGTLLGSYDSSYAYGGTHLLELNGDDGRVVITDTVRRYELARRGDPARTVWEAGYFDDRGRDFHATVDAYLDDMVPALRRGDPPPVPASAGLRALELAHAAIESFRTGRRVSV